MIAIIAIATIAIVAYALLLLFRLGGSRKLSWTASDFAGFLSISSRWLIHLAEINAFTSEEPKVILTIWKATNGHPVIEAVPAFP